MKIFNTLSDQKEEFIPQHKNRVNMYVCGITPYDETHVGHARAYVAFDTIRRYLEYKGFKVNYIQNITDVDDKIIAKAKGQGSSSQDIKDVCKQVAEKYTQLFFEDMDKLNVKRATKYPKATEHIKDMIKGIGELIKKGYAYVIDNDVYFEVAKFKDYGKLSKRDVNKLLSGARVEVDERKKSPLDFALWKSAKPNEPSWDSPWGKGRPGWHIECSVMSKKYLGETFDIHGGGRDLIFPHHENEIAQAEALTGKPFVKYWMHNGFITINKEKMSKSLGNFFVLREVLEKYDPMALRLFLLQTHYRSPIDFSEDQLKAAVETWNKINRFHSDLGFASKCHCEGRARSNLSAQKKIDCFASARNDKAEHVEVIEKMAEIKEKFIHAMDDDFNTAGAIAAVFELVHFGYKMIKQSADKKSLDLIKKLLSEFCGVLGIRIERTEHREQNTKEIEEWIHERNLARKNKDFAKADQIRDDLAKKGIIIEDTLQGTRWSKK